MQVETFRTHYETALTQLENDYSNFRSTGVQERPGFSAIVTHVKGCDGFQTWMHYPDDRTKIPEIANYPEVIVRSKRGQNSFKLGSNSTGQFYLMGLGSVVETEVENHHKKLAAPTSLAATHLPLYSMRQLVNDPRVKILSATDAPDAPSVVNAVFDLSSLQSYFARCEISFRKDLGMAIGQYKLYTTPVGGVSDTYFGNVEYGDQDKTGRRFPQTVTIESGVDFESRQLFTKWTSSGVVFGNVQESEFTLGHFGLATMDSGPRRTPWLIVVSGVVFLLSSIYLWLKRTKA